MSHKATNWLSDILPSSLGASEFRVLFHLCDCHNPSAGCFPTQAYLRDRADVSNGTLNNALNQLEQKGLIRRHKTRDGRTKRQNPTRYILGFEMEKPQAPTPISGDGKGPKPTPISGDGADSNLGGDPTPISGGGPSPASWRVTCKEPVNNHARTGEATFFTDDERGEARAVADHILAGKPVMTDAIPARVRACLVHGKMLADDLLETWGFAEKGQRHG